MDFAGLSLGPICPINSPTAPGVVATGAGATAVATPSTAAQVATTAATATTATATVTVTVTVTANAANQALIAQQATTAAAIAATLPTEFNSNNLPPEAKSRYVNHLHTMYLMTESDMQPFPIPLGGVCPVFSYFNPPMGSGVTQQPDSN